MTPPRRAIGAALLALTAVTGCLTDTHRPEGQLPSGASTNEADGGCGDTWNAHASGNAPLLAPFRGEPVAVAARLADAVRDPLASAEPDARMSSPDAPKYRTQSTGTVTVENAVRDDVPGRAHWFGGSDAEPYPLDEPHEAFLNDSLTRFGVDPALMTGFVDLGGEGPRLVRFWQAFDGELVEGTGGSFRPELPLLTLEPAFDLANATAVVSENASVDAARARMRCELDASGRTAEAGYAFAGVRHVAWGVVDESLVRTVNVAFTEPEDSHCGLAYAVDVDAATGAVLAWARPPCD